MLARNRPIGQGRVTQPMPQPIFWVEYMRWLKNMKSYTKESAPTPNLPWKHNMQGRPRHCILTRCLTLDAGNWKMEDPQLDADQLENTYVWVLAHGQFKGKTASHDLLSLRPAAAIWVKNPGTAHPTNQKTESLSTQAGLLKLNWYWSALFLVAPSSPGASQEIRPSGRKDRPHALLSTMRQQVETPSMMAARRLRHCQIMSSKENQVQYKTPRQTPKM